MSAQSFLDAACNFPSATLDDLLGEGGAVVVAPHPDDESLGCGALIAAARAKERSVKVVVLSDGTGSHPGSNKYPRERLRQLRKREVRKAVSLLGLRRADLNCLELPDRYVPKSGPEAESAARAVAEQLRKARANALFTTWRHDPHVDHQAAYDIARKAVDLVPRVRLFEYVIWGRDLPPEKLVTEAPRGWRFDGARVVALKQAAIACHRSQVTGLIDDDPKRSCLGPDVLARFASNEEIFFEIDP
ncbi:MAG: PIG-L family deacetylase [Bradyrhizobium sp.]|nr:PIG-L family deacetylase [Bradyrhizobium sp.]